MKITNIKFDHVENAGCNNGNHIPYTVNFDNGAVYEGETCRCRKGCHGVDKTDHLQVGMEFDDMTDYFNCVSVIPLM